MKINEGVIAVSRYQDSANDRLMCYKQRPDYLSAPQLNDWQSPGQKYMFSGTC